MTITAYDLTALAEAADSTARRRADLVESRRHVDVALATLHDPSDVVRGRFLDLLVALDREVAEASRVYETAKNALGSARTTARQIDKLTPGQGVTIRIGGREKELVTFVGLTGEGDARRATFRAEVDGKTYDWEAYRYRGTWAAGSSAERVSIALGE